jgi:hypothetical protein
LLDGDRAAETALSPDGQTVALTRVKDAVGREPVMYNIGPGLRPFSLADYGLNMPYAGSPSWSMDGTKLAWIAGAVDPQNGFDMTVVVLELNQHTSDSLHSFHVTQLDGNLWPPGITWSPNGDWAAYNRQENNQPVMFVWQLSSRTEFRVEGCHDFRFSPDGSWIACWNPQEADGNYRFYVLRPGETEKTLLLEGVTLAGLDSNYAGFTSAWRADSKAIAINPGDGQLWWAESGVWEARQLSENYNPPEGIVSWLKPIQVQPAPFRLEAVPTPLPVVQCPKAPPSRVSVQGIVRVSLSGNNLWLRNTPQVMEDNKVAKLSNGMVFQLVGGPVCAPRPMRQDDFLFWQASIPATGMTGWVAEGDLTEYYIEPVVD